MCRECRHRAGVRGLDGLQERPDFGALEFFKKKSIGPKGRLQGQERRGRTQGRGARTFGLGFKAKKVGVLKSGATGSSDVMEAFVFRDVFCKSLHQKVRQTNRRPDKKERMACKEEGLEEESGSLADKALLDESSEVGVRSQAALDAKKRAVAAKRWDDDGKSASFGELSIEAWRIFIQDRPGQLGQMADRMEQLVGGKARSDLFEFSEAFDPDIFEAIDEDSGDKGIFPKAGDRTKKGTQAFLKHLAKDA